ncbi:hypothetical protein BGW38_005133 [Lunasporangiospora selenospora]|uniref:Carboxypeptidase Taq n=1 Tax=Lunasporangiospora selenospora TaxID=979761 RepID=A0A9P6FZP7_9FUNG|nr:hypothetical protein BGW38_005133 [Lunasporangiospora selenospora]
MTVLAKSAAELRSESVRSLYDQLTVRLKDNHHLQSIANVLYWDQEVMMSRKSAAPRAEQMRVLAGVAYEAKTSPIVGSLLEELERRQETEDLSNILNKYELANIRLSRKAYKTMTLYPKELVQESASLDSKSVGAWTDARKESDFAKFAPFLKRQVEIAREKAGYKIKGGVSEEARRINDKARAAQGLKEDDICYKGYYQALMDTFEPGFKDERLSVLFEDLKRDLVPLIAKIKAKNFQHESAFLEPQWDVEKQKDFCHRISKEIGFDTEAGRLDVSTHPFSMGIDPLDVRMTTRYRTDILQEGIAGTVHETGHSLYEQGRNKDYASLPVSMALSTGVHESQSLLWERMVSLNKPFWNFALPLLKETFDDASHESLQSVDVEKFYKAYNRIEPGFIRVEADEVTYSLHVILRYEIEKALVEGDITVDDIPSLWNQKMKDYLGLDVTEDRVGCLQDTHWAIAIFGYFPTYTLGSIYSVQIFQHAQASIPNLDEHLSKGEFNVLREWLNENVHQQGSLLESGDDLIRDLTGKPLDSSIYVKYLTDKYTKIYDL